MIKLSRGRIILLSLVTSALILAVPAAISRRVRLAAAGLFEPVTSTAGSLLGGVRRRLEAFGRGTQLQQELEKERKRRLELETKLAETVEELSRLRRASSESAALEAKLREIKWRRGLPLPANVTRRPGRWESHELIIDRGTRSGVTARAPVLVGEAVLGAVAESHDRSARVLTLGHPELAVPARVVETRQGGLVEFSGGRLKLRYVVRDHRNPVRPEYTVVTSGLGGVFPPGCLIGKVGPGVTSAEGQPFYDITVEPHPEAGNPEVVWVLATPGTPGDKR